MEYRQL
ncbi:hypothetical protein LINGRAPRIM_LOCUS1723 [Linum grandiflorum]